MISDARREYIHQMISKYGRVIVDALDVIDFKKFLITDGKDNDFHIDRVVFDYVLPYTTSDSNLIIYWSYGYISYTVVSYNRLDNVLRELRLEELGI